MILLLFPVEMDVRDVFPLEYRSKVYSDLKNTKPPEHACDDAKEDKKTRKELDRTTQLKGRDYGYLFYDPRSDKADERYVKGLMNLKEGKKFESDATLSCPCCFWTVCFQCERHATNFEQYTAPSVQNCVLSQEESSEDSALADKIDDLTLPYRIVKCGECGTSLGILDGHNQYQLIHVLPSA